MSTDQGKPVTQNLLKLSDDKTNILYLASPVCVKSLKIQALPMGPSSITVSKNLFLTNVLKCMNMSH